MSSESPDCMCYVKESQFFIVNSQYQFARSPCILPADQLVVWKKHLSDLVPYSFFLLSDHVLNYQSCRTMSSNWRRTMSFRTMSYKPHIRGFPHRKIAHLEWKKHLLLLTTLERSDQKSPPRGCNQYYTLNIAQKYSVQGYEIQ